MISMTLNQKFAVFVVALVVAVSAPGVFIFGHEGGASVEQIVDGYLVDIGYSPEVLLSGEQTRFDFAIYDPETREEFDFTDIWVRILNEEDDLLFAGGLNKAEFGLTGLTYLFSNPGPYEVFVRFSDGSESIVETTAPIEVAKPDEGFALSHEISLVLAFLVGAIMAFLVTYLIPHRGNVESAPVVSTVLTDNNRYIQNFKEYFSNNSTAATVIIGLLCTVLAFYVTKTMLRDEPIDFSSEKVDTSSEKEQTVKEGEVSVVMTKSGFEPENLTIRKGTTVTFSTNVDRPFWPASDLHPTHEVYSDFDPRRSLAPDETWSFKFDRVGEWNMHDHLRSYFTGSIKVVE